MPSCFPFSRLCGTQVWAVFNKPSSSACVKLGCKYWLLAWLGWRCLYGILSALKWVQSSPVARVSQPACESPWQDVREPNVTRNAKKKKCNLQLLAEVSKAPLKPGELWLPPVRWIRCGAACGVCWHASFPLAWVFFCFCWFPCCFPEPGMGNCLCCRSISQR